MVKKPAVFIDRDGVINKKMPEGDYVKTWKEFIFLPGVFKAFQILKTSSFLVIIITNQRCIAKKIITEKQLHAIHDQMIKVINKQGGKIDAIYFCPHEVDACDCRKPRHGMILQAVADFKQKNIILDLNASYLIDDSEKSILINKNLDLKTIKIGKPTPHTPFTANSLLESLYFIGGVAE